MNSPMTFLGMPGLPPDLSTHGYELDQLTWWVHIIMAVLFVGWGAFFLYTLVRFRKSRNPTASYEGVTSHTSTYFEVSVAVIEAVLLFGLAIPLWADRVNVDFLFQSIDSAEGTEDVVQIRVVAQQFAWNVHYPGPDGKFGKTNINRIDDQINPLGLVRKDPNGKDDIVTRNMMVIPVERQILVHLTSRDVIHGFFLPVMRVKHDAIPGMTFPLWFEALKTSAQAKQEIFDEKKAAGDTELQSPDDVRDFEIACAQLCGGQHYKMRGFFHVVTEKEFGAIMKNKKEFKKWAKEKSKS